MIVPHGYSVNPGSHLPARQPLQRGFDRLAGVDEVVVADTIGAGAAERFNVVLHGLLCAIPPLFSLAVCLRMLRGVFAPLRFWIVLGILLAPLPGQIVFVSENNSVLQLAWVCLAFVWCGCPWRWAPAPSGCVAGPNAP